MALTTNIRIGRFALVAAALLTLGMDTPASGSAGSRNCVETAAAKQTETVGSPGIYGADPELTAVIESSIGRFDSVGLTLPDLRIYYHSDPSGCPGATALGQR